MTPNQAQELHDIIRESGLPDAEQRRLHTIVDADITTPPVIGHGYIRILTDGNPIDTVIEAVDPHGNKVALELAELRFRVGWKDSTCELIGSNNIHMRGAAMAWRATLTLPVSGFELDKIADCMGRVEEDLDAAPSVDITAIPTEPEPIKAGTPIVFDGKGGYRAATPAETVDLMAKAAELSELAAESGGTNHDDGDNTEETPSTEEITKVETPKKRGEAPRGAHEHTFVNGLCGWCGKRE